MKTAVRIDKEGGYLVASASAPEKAKCPFCGGLVILRHRRLMNNSGTTYYWKHRGNLNRNCTARVRPAHQLRQRIA